MYIKIYFDDKPVFICNEIDAELKELLKHPDAIYIDEISNPAINSLLHEIKKPGFHTAVLFSENLDEAKKAFFKHFILVQAAGGLVFNEKHKRLLIFRNGKWDLPKGKLEKGEDLANCAAREVEEETGIHDVHLLDFICITYHTYNDFGKQFLKESHWYRMSAPAGQTLVPQTEEGITELKWVAENELIPYLDNTYASIREVMAGAV